MTPDFFKTSLEEMNIDLTTNQARQFQIYTSLLQEWNEKINLTSITETQEIYLKHFLDSLMIAKYHDFNGIQKICDIGSGAGFPSLPLKIIYPELHVTIVDSLKKRIDFLNLLVEALGLDHVTLIHGRAEDIGQDDRYRASFDLVTARAVARLNVLSEYCLPLVKKSGRFLAMKGSQGEEELTEAMPAIEKLGGQLLDLKSFELPEDEGERTIILIEKIKNTPAKFPRQAGKPSKQPIK